MKKKNLVNNLITVILLFALTVSLYGCGGLDITEEESRQIAEYSAGLLLKYDKNYSGSLRNVEVPKEVSMVKEEVVVEPEPILQEEPIIESEPTPLNDAQSSDNKDMPVYSDIPLGTFLETEGLEINYKGVEVSKEYPPADSGDAVFSLQSLPGNSFLIVHFDISNISDHDIQADFSDKKVKYKASINGEKAISNSKSILLNDLEQFIDTIPAYGTVDSVVVFEEEDSFINSVGSLDLSVKYNGEKVTYKLF